MLEDSNTTKRCAGGTYLVFEAGIFGTRTWLSPRGLPEQQSAWPGRAMQALGSQTVLECTSPILALKQQCTNGVPVWVFFQPFGEEKMAV